MNNFNLTELNNYLNIIFDLQNKLLDKDFKIMNLEFELALKKQMLDAFNKYKVQEDQYVE